MYGVFLNIEEINEDLNFSNDEKFKRVNVIKRKI